MHSTFSKLTGGELKDLTNHRVQGVKLPKLRAVWAGQEWILPLVKRVHFFLASWHQMDLVNGEVSNIEKNYVIGYYIDFLSKF